MHVGQRVSSARKGRGWSREQLAATAGVEVAQLVAIEASASPVDADLPDVLHALDLAETVIIAEPIVVGFLNAVRPTVEQIPPADLPEALAACLAILGRAAGGTGIPYAARNVQVFHGPIGSVDQGDVG